MEATARVATADRPSGFKSPLRLLLSFFRKSRDQWKAKATRRRAKIKNLEHKVRDIDDSRTNWKHKAQQLEADKKALEERLRVVEAEREQLRAQLEEHEAKKASRPVVR
jgi:septal ring factor EnvC (AmiA/AmiB activator)